MRLSALVARRIPEGRPGPGPLPEAVLRALDVHVRRRIDGLLAGDSPTTATGPGTELALVRPYEIGDDVRRLEWNVTARTGVPHVRVEVAERALDAWVLLDTSPSMAFGTADRRKSDVAVGTALAVSHAVTRRSGRTGVATFAGEIERVVPPGRGHRAVVALLAALEAGAGGDARPDATLAPVLRRAAALARRRGAVFVVTDLIGPVDWRDPLLELASRHDVVVVEVRDPREDDLPDVGEVWLSDPETGRQLLVDTSSERLRREFAEAAAAERAEVRRAVAGAGAQHVVLSTSGDWLRALATFFRVRRFAR